MNVEWRVEKAEYAEFNGPTWSNIAIWQLCRERQPVWKSRDGLNLTCLDQCHGVRFHGTSTSQGWRKRIVGQSTVQIWVYILVFDEGDFCRFAKESLPTEIGKGRHWTHVFFCGCANNAPRFAQGQPNGYFQMKELDGTIGPIAQMCAECWACWVQRANMWQHCSLSAVQRQTNSKPFPDCILVFDEGDFCRFA